MRKLFVLFIFLLSSNVLLSQVDIGSRLQEALNNANPSDYIKVLVLLRSQVDLATLDQQLYSQKSTMQQRAYQVITALKQNAENTQSNLRS